LERYVWFALKDPRVLHGTVFWLSNGGRHYAPWNGRHCNVLGLEEVTSYFHPGLAESVQSNPLVNLGHPTCAYLQPEHPLTVNYIMAVAKTPPGFDHVVAIEASQSQDSVRLTSASGKSVTAVLDAAMLRREIAEPFPAPNPPPRTSGGGD